MDLEVQVEREKAFKGAIKIWAPWKPGYVSSGTLLIPEGETQGKLQLKATDRAIPGNYPFVLSAHQDPLTHKGDDIHLGSGTGFDFVASNQVNIEVVQPYVEVKLARTAIERQQDGFIVAKLQHLRPTTKGCNGKVDTLASWQQAHQTHDH